MLRWSVMAAMVGASVWTVACGLDAGRTRQAATVFMDAGSGSTIFLDAPASGSDGGIFLDAPVFSDAGIGSGSGSAGSGSGFPDAGIGSGAPPPDAGVFDDAGVLHDASTGQDARRGNPETLDQTSFYTCASCGSGTDARLAIVLVVGVAAVLRRRRR